MDYMNIVARILLSILLIFSTFPLKDNTIYAETNDANYVVSAPILNLREGPGLTFPIMKELKKNDRLTMVEKRGDWVRVSQGETEGWVASWLIKKAESNSENIEEQHKVVVSKVDHLNVRKEPSLNAAVLTQMHSGAQATYKKESGDWIEVNFNKITGWVNKQFILIEDAMTTYEPEEQKTQSVNQSKTIYFTVSVSAVNIRKKPDLNSKKLGTIKQNERYEILNQNANWIEIEYSKGKKGWVFSFYGTINETPVENKHEKIQTTNKKVQILYEGTNIRTEPNTNSKVLQRAKIGETFEVVSIENDWYKINIGKETGYVANWVVKLADGKESNKTNSKEKDAKKEERKKGTLKGLTIVIDPGHGGNDHGTTGAAGTPEKSITSSTAELLKNKLRSAGADVILTRESDKYVDLRKRVAVAHQHDADAFISIHYDAADSPSIKGFTTYYMNSNQKKLAEAVHKGLSKRIELRDRGVQPGNYLVLRENSKPSVLLELGYLSNRDEERIVTTDYFREQATQGIYEGLLSYFDEQIK